MDTIAIRPCAVSDLERSPSFADLLAEYGRESAISGLGEGAAQLETYRWLSASGALHALGAFHGETLVGFVALLVAALPHYGVQVATTESFFVGSAYRKTGAGLKLLRAAEAHAKELGAVGLLVSAPFGGRLAEVMPRVGYRETNRVFFRSLSGE